VQRLEGTLNPGEIRFTSGMTSGLLAFIGGTGFDLRGPHSPFDSVLDQAVSTRFGVAHVTTAELRGRPIVFLHRHAQPDNPSKKTVPPHRINYRANIAALKSLGVTGILASTAVGGMRPEWGPGTLVLLDNLIDCTTSRDKTFFDERAVHVDATHPYCAQLRSLLGQTATREQLALEPAGTYICTDGPRFETAAEIRAYARWGADVVGMTGAPECFLAREAEIAYAGVSIVTNFAAGISPDPLTHTEVLEAMDAALPRLARLFLAAAGEYEDDPLALSRRATRGFATHGYDPASEILGA